MLRAILKIFSLLICGSTGNNNNNILNDAVVSVITEICASDKITSSIIFESKCVGNFTFMDDINHILLESSKNHKIALQIETDKSLPHNMTTAKCNIIMISSCSNFMTVYEAANIHDDLPLVIVFYDDVDHKILDEIFTTLWRANIHKVNAFLNDIRNEGVVDVMTFFPFRHTKCNDTSPVLINRFVNGSSHFINSTMHFFPDKMTDLHQCPINVSTANNSQPYVFATKLLNGSYDIHGRDIKLLNALAEALNFKIKYVYVGREGVLLENGTAQGALKTLVDGRGDIAIADLWLKANRLKFIDATSFYITQTIAFVIPPGSELTSFEKYVKPLDIITWMCLLVTVAIALFVIYVVKKMSRDVQEFIFGKGVNDPYMNVIIALLGGSQTTLPQKNFSRFLLMMFLIFCLVMRTLYQGSLYRFLQSTISHKEVQSIDEMIERDYKFYVVPSILDLIEGQPRIYQRKVVMTLEQRSLLYNKSRDPSFKGVFPRSFTGVLYSNQMNYNISIDLICKEKFMTFPVVIYTRKGFYLLNTLNMKIMHLQAAGLIDYWHSEIIDQRYLHIKESKEPRPIKVQHLSGGFMIMLIGCAIAFCLFICEILYVRIMISPLKCDMIKRNRNVHLMRHDNPLSDRAN